MTSSTDVVERVARAIHSVTPHEHEWDDDNKVVRGGNVIVTAEELREEWRSIARAALQATGIDELVEACKPTLSDKDWENLDLATTYTEPDGSIRHVSTDSLAAALSFLIDRERKIKAALSHFQGGGDGS